MSEDEDKQHDPSQKRLDEARKRGDIPKSNDLITAASYGGFLIAVAAMGTQILGSLGQIGKSILDQPDRMADLFFSTAGPPLLGIMLSVMKASAPLLLLPALGAIGAIFAQRAMHFAPEKISFKGSRVSMTANAAQKFGPGGLFEFAKSLAKLIVVGLILTFALSRHGTAVLQSMQSDTAQSIGLTMSIMFEFLLIVVLILVGFGGVDYLWQRHQHIKKNRMSRKELMDEAKDAEGDPHVKQQRRQMGHDIANSQSMQDVATADVVIVNPTHYAVALKWNRKGNSAPICVAKGVDEIAATIREKAAEAGVPLHSDPPTARAIFATVNVGEQIKTEHFRAVAAAIRFSETMRKRQREMKYGR